MARPSCISVRPSDPRSLRSGRCRSTGAGSRHFASLAAHRLGLPTARRSISPAVFAARSARTSGARVPRVAERYASLEAEDWTRTPRFPRTGGPRVRDRRLPAGFPGWVGSDDARDAASAKAFQSFPGTSTAASIHRGLPTVLHIAFNTGADNAARVYVARADGSDARAITRPRLFASAPEWSPDGGLIAMIGAGKPGQRRGLCHQARWFRASSAHALEGARVLRRLAPPYAEVARFRV